jgi:hypothetical protein
MLFTRHASRFLHAVFLLHVRPRSSAFSDLDYEQVRLTSALTLPPLSHILAFRGIEAAETNERKGV